MALFAPFCRLPLWWPRRCRDAVVLALLLAAGGAAAPAWAADSTREVLDDFRAHGYPSPLLALERLQQAAPDAAANDPAGQDLRWRYESALASLALSAGDNATAQAALTRLRAMAEQEHCAPCATALLLRQTRQAEAAGGNDLRQRLAALNALPEPSDPQLQYEWYIARSAAQSILGDYEAAIAEALKASESATLHDRPADLVTSLAILSSTNASRRDLPRALEYTRQGIALAREIGFHFALVRLLVNHSYSLATMKENTERKAVLEELLRLTESTRGLQKVRLNTLINLAALSNDTHDYNKAVDYASRAERAADRETDPNGYAFTLVNRGVAWAHLGRADEGLALVKTSIDIAEKTGDKRELADLIEQQVDAFEAAGRPQAALQALRRWVELNNELTSSQREQAVTQLQETFAAQQRARQIENLKLDNARREAELQVRSWRERAWAAAAVMVALLAFISWKRLTRSRTINRGLRQDVARLSDESHHDPMTGAYNRRFGEALLQRLENDNAGQPDSRRRAVSLLLLDVDHFKRVNDTHGHAAGDAVLVEMTQRLQAMLRDGDAVVRWGGEEFLLILPGTDANGLQVVAERALAAIGQAPIDLSPGKRLAIRASAGGVTWRAGGGTPWADRLALADAALYQAKADGRNRAISALADEAFSEDALQQLPSLVAQGRVHLKTVAGVAPPEAANGQPTPEAALA
ncbi:diguanylate cyclase domain-containing protein [Ideonella sp.]|uniref:diguanylate cyclase domain-containing protein n=1 Tax=Ideonella sp. TaxID=1929293 RepID=UPI0035B0B700